MAVSELAKQHFPELAENIEKWEKERDAIQKKSEPARNAREALLKQIKPLEDKLSQVDEEIAAIERPRLGQLSNQIAAAYRGMGSKGLQAETGVVGVKSEA